jgi:hypothetical protein
MEPNAEDLAAQEAAAREYQPQLEVTAHTPLILLDENPRSRSLRNTQGPLVGRKTPSTAIVEEYAKADPVYVQKTMVGNRCRCCMQRGADGDGRFSPRHTHITDRSRGMGTAAGGVSRFTLPCLTQQVLGRPR